MPNAQINNCLFSIPDTIGLTAEGTVPAMNLEELKLFLNSNPITENVSRETNDENITLKNNIINLLHLAQDACSAGVTRVHIVNSSLDGSIPCEIFSDFGSGTMIYANNYGKIRDMTREDIPSVLNVMRPFVKKGILLPRTKQSLSEQYVNYIVYELDGAIRACASLIPYPDGQMEIAGIAVDKDCSHIGIGPKLMDFLIKRAKQRNAKGLFLLTTQTADWFENLGFTQTDIASLPEKRKEKWTPQRGSKALRLY